jgi:hypothetical protein
MRRLLPVLLLAAAISAPVAAAASPLPPGYHSCGKVSGPTITQPWEGGKPRAMNHYGVGATTGVTCAFATRWVTKIVHESTAGGLLPHPAGPPSWRCTAGDVIRHVATSGFCHDGGNKKGFSWGAEP